MDATIHGDDHKSLNVLDRRFIWAVGWWKKTEVTKTAEASRTTKWKLVLQKVLLTLSDAHLLTGLAILIAGFTQICTITAFHYHAVVYLAWTSSSVHMVTLTISRFYLRSNKPILIVRLVFMSALFILLFIALCLTASTKWPTATNDNAFTFDAQAVCTLADGNWRVWRGDTVFALILLSLGYIFRLCKVFETTSDGCRKWLRTVPEDFLKRGFVRCQNRRDESPNFVSRAFWQFMSWLVLSSYLYVRAFYDIFESLLVELIWMTLSLLWGFAQIFSWQQNSPVRRFETQWSFGQILPLLLVAAPLIALPEFYADSKETLESVARKKNDKADREVEMAILTETPVALAKSYTFKPLKMRRSFWTESTVISSPSSTIKTNVPFLDKTNEAYRSVNYNILVFLLFAAGLAVFGIIISPKFQTRYWIVRWGNNTSDTWSTYFYNIGYWLYIWLPILGTPGVLWFVIMAPMSRIIRRALRQKAPSLLGGQSP